MLCVDAAAYTVTHSRLPHNTLHSLIVLGHWYCSNWLLEAVTVIFPTIHFYIASTCMASNRLSNLWGSNWMSNMWGSYRISNTCGSNWMSNMWGSNWMSACSNMRGWRPRYRIAYVLYYGHMHCGTSSNHCAKTWVTQRPFWWLTMYHAI